MLYFSLRQEIPSPHFIRPALLKLQARSRQECLPDYLNCSQTLIRSSNFIHERYFLAWNFAFGPNLSSSNPGFWELELKEEQQYNPLANGVCWLEKKFPSSQLYVGPISQPKLISFWTPRSTLQYQQAIRSIPLMVEWLPSTPLELDVPHMAGIPAEFYSFDSLTSTLSQLSKRGKR